MNELDLKRYFVFDLEAYLTGTALENTIKEQIDDLGTVMNYVKLTTEAALHSQIKAKSYIVGSFTPTQGISFSSGPMVQYTETAARAECRRLAELNKNKTYFYVQLKGGEKVIANPQNLSI